jgi:hypothetical protein
MENTTEDIFEVTFYSEEGPVAMRFRRGAMLRLSLQIDEMLSDSPSDQEAHGNHLRLLPAGFKVEA